jgi:TonB family protein
MLHALQDEPERGTRWITLVIGIIIATLIQAGGILGVSRLEPAKRIKRGAVIMKINIQKPKPKPKKVEKPKEKKPKPKKKKKKKKRKKKRKKKKYKKQAKQKQAPPKPQEPPKKIPMIITGLTLKSTGGTGPTVQVGNTMSAPVSNSFKKPVTDKAPAGNETMRGEVEPVFVSAKLIRKVKPRYTALALNESIQGNVVLIAYINKAGKVTGSKISKGLGFGLDEEAQKTVKLWSYKPATLDGVAVKSNKKITMKFRIEEDL